MLTKVPFAKLLNGMKMPMLGLGTYKEIDKNKLKNAVKAAINAGYGHIDCAYIYFNEQHIGKAINESIQESNNKLSRQDFFIVSKCWNTFHSRAKVPQCLDISLKNLGLSYLDLYLIHWPFGFKVIFFEN